MSEKKKLLAVVAGSRMGNTEILAKEALMAAAKYDHVEVELLRLPDLDLHPCIACRPCTQIKNGTCIWKDDGEWVENKVKDCDALLICASCYSLTPPAGLTILRDRVMGPRLDAACTDEVASNPDMGQGGMFEGVPMLKDPRLRKKRVAGIITIGGAIEPDWTSLIVPICQTCVFPAGMKLIDIAANWGCADQGSVLVKPGVMESCQRVGEHLAEALKDVESAHWMGGEQGICPICHNDVYKLHPEDGTAECAVCGIRGSMTVENGKFIIDYPAESLAVSRYYDAGRAKHGKEVAMVAKAFAPYREQVKAMLPKYREYKDCILVPPSRQKKG